MNNIANISDIAIFLENAKALISAGRYDFVPRRKNMQSLAQHGLTITDAKAELLELVVRDYYKGPKQDFNLDKPGTYGNLKYIAGRLFYIKLKITQENGTDILKCLGFHEDDFA